MSLGCSPSAKHQFILSVFHTQLLFQIATTFTSMLALKYDRVRFLCPNIERQLSVICSVTMCLMEWSNANRTFVRPVIECVEQERENYLSRRPTTTMNGIHVQPYEFTPPFTCRSRSERQFSANGMSVIKMHNFWIRRALIRIKWKSCDKNLPQPKMWPSISEWVFHLMRLCARKCCKHDVAIVIHVVWR